MNISPRTRLRAAWYSLLGRPVALGLLVRNGTMTFEHHKGRALIANCTFENPGPRIESWDETLVETTAPGEQFRTYECTGDIRVKVLARGRLFTGTIRELGS